MRPRAWLVLFIGCLLTFIALTYGNAFCYAAGVLLLVSFLFSLVTILIVRLTFRFSQQLSCTQPERGSSANLVLFFKSCPFLLIAAVHCQVQMPSGTIQGFSFTTNHPLTTTRIDYPLSCLHVGLFFCGLRRVTLSDALHLFSFTKEVKGNLPVLCVLPKPAQTSPIPCAQGEGEDVTQGRADPDRNTPADIRLWQEGDDLKRVHWKLTLRRQTLMVHTYETPQRPDALVLPDCAPPDCDDSRRPMLIDALTETCAGILRSLLEAERPVLLSMSGAHPRELRAHRPEELGSLLCALAEEPFTQQTDFARALMLCARQISSVGSVVILSTTLSPGAAEAILSFARAGTRMVFVLVRVNQPDKRLNDLLSLLIDSGVETRQVIPASHERVKHS